MQTVILLAKAPHDSQLRFVDGYVQSLLEGLRVEVEPSKTDGHGFVNIDLMGEDEKIAVNYLSARIGLCPIRIEGIRENGSIKGFISRFDRDNGDISIDIGITDPKPLNAQIPLSQLQAQLCDGRRLAPQKVWNLFGLCENMPLKIRMLRLDTEPEEVEACLANEQVSLFKDWMEAFLDRLVVVGSTHSAVEFALKRSGFYRDVVETKELGLFEHLLICKLGTDAVGLVPKIGRILLEARFGVFSPRKIMSFFGRDSSLFSLS